MRGKLITLEGIDGSGKSTVAKKLQDNPEIKTFKPVFTREPTRGTLTGIAVEKAIQSDTDQLAELFLFTADHAEHLAKLVKPTLESGNSVISDRYSDSRYAYQGVTLKNRLENPLEWVKNLHRGWTVIPDMTFLLISGPKSQLNAVGSGEIIASLKNRIFAKCRELFLKLAEEDTERFIIVDASQPPESLEKEVTEKVLELLRTN